MHAHPADEAPGTPNLLLAAYDRQQASDWLRRRTPQELLGALQAGTVAGQLHTDEVAELATLLQDWQRRALGLVTLRDAIWVDQQRGARVYTLLCRALTVAEAPLPPAAARSLGQAATELTPPQVRAALEPQAEPAAGIARLLNQAEAEGLALASYPAAEVRYPLPANLNDLLPPLPPLSREPAPQFAQPTGSRRTLALGLALAGASALVIPLILGHMPTQPAGLSLGLLTLALLVGIRAGWPGFLGSFCIWLVPNLPGFHHGTPFSSFLYAVPLLLVGMLLLALDGHVRALWRWLWQWLTGGWRSS